MPKARKKEVKKPKGRPSGYNTPGFRPSDYVSESSARERHIHIRVGYIKDLLKKRGLTQRQFAQICSIDPTYLPKVWRVQNPTLEIIGRMAHGLGVSVHELIGDGPPTWLPPRVVKNLPYR